MSPKHLLRIGIATFVAFFALALIYYKERCSFDISFHLFSILKDDGFAIQNNRFAAFFTQLFPLLGSKLGLSLKTLAILYTVSFVVLQAGVFALILLWLRNTRVALAYLLYLVLMTTQTFFWIQSEMPQGLAFYFLFLALTDNALQKDRLPSGFLFAAPVLLFTVGFAHPLLLFPFLFGLLLLQQFHPGHKRSVLSLAMAGVVIFLCKSIFMGNSYDADKMSGIANIIKFFPDYFTLKSNGILMRWFLHNYYFVPIGLGAGLYFYGTTGQWRKLILLAAFFLGYTALINISNPDGGDQFYFENFYLPLAAIVALPLAFDVLPALSTEKLRVAAVGLVCLVCMIRIWDVHEVFTRRIEWQRAQLDEIEKSPAKKWMVHPGYVPTAILIQDWTTPYEIWLLSTTERGQSASMMNEWQPGEFDWAVPQTKGWITRWGVFEYSTLNPKYFKFTDTTSAYIKR